MKIRLLSHLTFVLCGLMLSLNTHAVVIKKTAMPTSSAITQVERQSPITKALNQQKRLDQKLENNDKQLKVLTSLKGATTQNILADQNLRFSRFIQSIFSSQNS